MMLMVWQADMIFMIWPTGFFMLYFMVLMVWQADILWIL
jgi:hypothetical protein